MANGRGTVAESAARQLANATKTRAQWLGITPRWLIPFLPWTPVEAGIFRLNRVKETRGATAVSADDVEFSPARDDRPGSAGDLRRLRGAPPRVFLERDHHRARRPDPRVRPLQPPLRPDPGAAPHPHREGQGDARERAHQQPGIRPARQRRAVDDLSDAHRRADARRS